jgi:hypothetical protein
MDDMDDPLRFVECLVHTIYRDAGQQAEQRKVEEGCCWLLFAY